MMKVNWPASPILALSPVRLALASMLCLVLGGNQPVFAAPNQGSQEAIGLADALTGPAPRQRQPSKQPVLGLAISGSNIIGVGLRGLIIMSKDHGKSWHQIASPVSSDLVAVYFSDAMHGWAVGQDSVLLKTKDGGKSWSVNLDGRRLKKILVKYYSSTPSLGESERAAMLSDVELSTSTSANPDVIPTPLLNISIDSEGKGFVVGAFGMLLYTDDNGENWVPWVERADNKRLLHLYGLAMRGDQVYISGEQGLLMRLNRKQGRFVAVDIPYKGTLFGVSVQNGLVIAYGLRGHAFVSKDKGGSWRKIDTGVKGSVVDVVKLDDTHSLLVSQRGELARLNDRNLSAEKVDAGLVGSVYSSVILQHGGILVAAQFGGVRTLGINNLQ